MAKTEADLPFKISDATIVIVKALPVLQCERCPEFALDDIAMERVDEILRRADARAELVVVRFAA
jgi:YgiT-type zinc finger domain-containing protein